MKHLAYSIVSRWFIPWALLLVLPLSGCSRNLGLAPTTVPTKMCQTDSNLPGTWVRRGTSNLGPGKMVFRFNCDCTYEARIRFLFFKFREGGKYWTEEDRLFLTRASGETTSWPFLLETESLMLREAADENHAYQRKRQPSCSGF